MSVLTDEGIRAETFESRQARVRTPGRLEQFFAGQLCWGELEGLEREQLDWAVRAAHELASDGDLESAHAVLLALALLDHRNASVLARLATLTAALGDRPAALGYCNRALALAPELLECRALRGELLLEAGSLEEGVADLVRAVELDPHDRNAVAARARLLLQGVLRAASLRLGLPPEGTDDAEAPSP